MGGTAASSRQLHRALGLVRGIRRRPELVGVAMPRHLLAGRGRQQLPESSRSVYAPVSGCGRLGGEGCLHCNRVDQSQIDGAALLPDVEH
jgi:hypothetical protein